MEYSIAHKIIYGRVRQGIKGNITERKNILKILRWYIRIPSQDQLAFLKEMETLGLFKRISRDKYENLFIKENKNCKKTIDKIMSFILKLEEPFREEFLNLMKNSKYIKMEEDKYEVLWKDIPKDIYRNDGNPLWD